MGHIRLGNLPRTRKWQQVVALIEGGGSRRNNLAPDATATGSKKR